MTAPDKQQASPAGSVWKRLSDWLEKLREPPAGPVVQVITPFAASCTKLAPGPFSVHVVGHALPTRNGLIDCWTYVTDGFQQHQLPEIVFTLLRQPQETVAPEDLIQFFQAIYQSTVDGDQPHAGAFGVHLLGRNIVHIPTPSLPGVAVPAGAQGAILVTYDELRAVMEFGITRVMARLGQVARYYPCPPWSDPERERLSFEPVRQQTILRLCTRQHLTGGCVYQENGGVTLRLTKAAGDLLEKKLTDLPDKSALALLTELCPDADGCLVWEPGQVGPVVIAKEGRPTKRICGCFLALITGQKESGCLSLEDGFAVFLTASWWQAFREAVIQKERIHIPADGTRLPLTLEWNEPAEETHRPAEQDPTLLEPGAGRSFDPAPAGGKIFGANKVWCDSWRLLTPPDALAGRSTLEDITRFVRQVGAQAEAVLGNSTDSFELRVQFKCTASGHRFRMAHQGEAKPELLQEFGNALQAMKTLNVEQDEVQFQVNFTIRA